MDRALERTRARRTLAASYGLLVLAMVLALTSKVDDSAGNALFYLAFIGIIYGTCVYAHSKGYSYSLGFLCLLGFGLGPLIVWLLREKPQTVAEAAASATAMGADKLMRWAGDLRATGRFDEAEAAYRELITRYPDTDMAADAQRKLDSLEAHALRT